MNLTRIVERQRRLEQALARARQQGAQVEPLTARVEHLEARMAEVLDALPKIKVT